MDTVVAHTPTMIYERAKGSSVVRKTYDIVVERTAVLSSQTRRDEKEDDHRGSKKVGIILDERR